MLYLKVCANKLAEHDELMTNYKAYIKSKDYSPIKKQPDEYVNIDVKEELHKSLKQLLEEVVNTHQTHYKVRYLARANEWYNNKIALIDEKLRKIPIKISDSQLGSSKKELK